MKEFLTIKSKSGNYIIELLISKDKLAAYIRVCKDDDVIEASEDIIKTSG